MVSSYDIILYNLVMLLLKFYILVTLVINWNVTIELIGKSVDMENVIHLYVSSSNEHMIEYNWHANSLFCALYGV